MQYARNGDESASPFDAIRRTRSDDSEYWSARDMQPLMGYSRWQSMSVPLNRARSTARNQGLDVDREFAQVSQVTRSGNLGDQAREDYELTRGAAYLVAMNGDPNKPEVAAAQLYFAAKTREAETGQSLNPIAGNPTPEIEAAHVGEARLRMLKAAEGLVDSTWLEGKVRLTVARGLGEEPEIDPLDVPLYVPDYLKDKGLNKTQIKSAEGWFGRYAVKICRQLGVDTPSERQSEAANGSVRKTRAWTERHRPVFDATWSQHYASKYDIQQRLGTA